MRHLDPELPAQAWHAPAGEDDLPCMWPIGSGRLIDVLEKVRKLPASEHGDIYITLNGITDVTAGEWPFIPIEAIEIASGNPRG